MLLPNLHYLIIIIFFPAKENDYQKALDLWTDMQDQDITPSDDFLIRLDALLKENDIVVPFAVPMKKEFRSNNSDFFYFTEERTHSRN